MSDADIDLMPRLTKLKQFNPGLQTWISVGGWSMNDPDQPTAKTFSQLAASSSAQSSFFRSLIQFMETYGFDGVDIDWEYPVAPERSGEPSDFTNYVSFLRNLRTALGSSGHNYGLTITIPSSYWYMQNFDIKAIEPIIDWFNVMTYDLHGTWDSTDPYIGPYVYAHTNLTEIDQTMQLLWRNNIDPSKVTLGMGFYGRSFTLSDPSCSAPGCPFNAGGTPGDCSQSAGTLNFAEIEDIISQYQPAVQFDETAAVKYINWNSDQWVSYDDQDTLKLKVDYANSHCLGGVMVWAASTDDALGSAAHYLDGANGRDLSDLAVVSNLKSGLNQCMWGDCNQSCPGGFSAVERSSDGGGGAVTPAGLKLGCPADVSRPFCCPSNDAPTCHWAGTSPLCANNQCNFGEVAVTTDVVGDGDSCLLNHKTLCCSTAIEIPNCQFDGSCTFFFGSIQQNICPASTKRSSGLITVTETWLGLGGSHSCGPPTFYQPYCCQQGALNNCSWHDQGAEYQAWPPVFSLGSGLMPVGPHECTGACPSGQVSVISDSTTCTLGTRANFCCDDPSITSNPAGGGDPFSCELPDGVVPTSGEPDSGGSIVGEIEYNDFEADCYIGGVDGSGDPSASVSVFEKRDELDPYSGDYETHYLEPRGSSRNSKLCKNKPGKTRNSIIASLKSSAYNTVDTLVTTANKRAFFRNRLSCSLDTIESTIGSVPQGQTMVAEHVYEIQTVKTAFQSMLDGILPGGGALNTGQLPWNTFRTTSNANSFFFKTWSSLNVATGNFFGGSTPAETFYNIVGTKTDNDNLLAAATDINSMKAILWQGSKNPIAAEKWKKLNGLQRAGALKLIKATFDYMNTDDAQNAMSTTISKTKGVMQTLQNALASDSININYDFTGAYQNFLEAHYDWVGQRARDWLTSNDYFASTIQLIQSEVPSGAGRDVVITTVRQLQASLTSWAVVDHEFINGN
ncbi:hypothetical protein FH972_023850 [Carpinus fangiana]|uniref:GH18 domain-containing protein n=1 Tax=Carpinus fangiana TaxID=176857 RepID=A0A5N6KWM3_9ROSI|nr:hypothetical protein FH972_023850 [Carpinus fangiana]